MKTHKRLLLLLLCISVLSPAFAESVPRLVSYQGKLTDATGQPLPDGTYGIAVRIWAKKTANEPGDTLVWGQETPVAVQNGVFNTILGSGPVLTGSAVNDLGFAFNVAERFIGVTVTKGTNGIAISNAQEIQPRQKRCCLSHTLSKAALRTMASQDRCYPINRMRFAYSIG